MTPCEANPALSRNCDPAEGLVALCQKARSLSRAYSETFEERNRVMRTYLYAGTDRNRDLARLVSQFAGLQVPICLVRLGEFAPNHTLAAQASSTPIDLLHIRLPGLGLPRTHTPGDDVLIQTALATLGQIVASGDHRLIVLDGIRAATARGLLDAGDLRRLVQMAPEGTELALA